MSDQLLNADMFKGVFDVEGPSGPGRLAELETDYRDAVKLATADEGKTLQPDVMSMIRGPQLVDYGAAMQSMVGQIQEAIKAVNPDLVKDWTLTAPLSTGLVPFDLEAPSKKLFPVLTPLRNRLPRTKGIGTSRRAKRITGISGSGTGGVGLTRPFTTTSTTTTWGMPSGSGPLTLNRPPKISYAADEINIPYQLQGLSDQVDWMAFWSGAGFEDVRALSNTILLKAMMLAEERSLLGGRGTASGFQGALATPAATAGAVAAPGTGQVGILGTGAGGTNVYVRVTAQGIYGESAASAATTYNIPVTVTDVINITITDVVGALGYNVYASFANTGGADPGNASRFFQGRTSYNAFTIQGPLAVSGPVVPTGADTASGANDYDGILTTLSALGGYATRLNAKLSATYVEIETAFAALWDNVKADPDEIWANGRDRMDMSDLLRNQASTLAYRINLDNQGGATAGTVLASLFNPVTGKEVRMSVHPWLPRGNLPILSYTLPIQDSQVPAVLQVVNVQDYFSVQWPQIQSSYDASVYLYGSLVFYAPTFCAILHGVQPQIANQF